MFLIEFYISAITVPLVPRRLLTTSLRTSLMSSSLPMPAQKPGMEERPSAWCPNRARTPVWGAAATRPKTTAKTPTQAKARRNWNEIVKRNFSCYFNYINPIFDLIWFELHLAFFSMIILQVYFALLLFLIFCLYYIIALLLFALFTLNDLL